MIADFKLIRSFNKDHVRQQIAKELSTKQVEEEISYSDMRYSGFTESMRRIAKMREVADEAGLTFAAFFRGPSGRCYYVTNLKEEES